MQLSAQGLLLVASIGLCTYAGYWLDQWLDSSPLLLIAGALFGAGAGMWQAVRDVERVTGPRESHGAPDDESP